MNRSKRYEQAVSMVDKKKEYLLPDAVAALKKMPKPKFDETIEVACTLNIDAKKSDQLVRGSVSLPHGIGKKTTIVVFCEPEKEADAKKAGADFAGSTELIEKISQGWTDFDYCIATPAMMAKVSKLGKVLGPRGLMPSAKTGSVTENIDRAVKETKLGKIDFKTDKTGCIQVGIGKLSFSEKQITENIKAFLDALLAQRPASVSGNLLRTVTVSSTMSPGIRLAGVE